MGQMTTCCGTSGLGNTSLWTLSSPHPRVDSHPGVTHAASSLSQTRASFMWLKRKSEVFLAVKQFSKEIGAPDAIFCDMSGEQMPPDIKQFCNMIRTTLQALEEGMPWADKAC